MAARTREIDDLLRKARRDDGGEVKILLLGPGESGKSTVAKQMKIIHLSGFNDAEKQIFKKLIAENIYTAMEILLEQVEQRELELRPDNQTHEETLQGVLQQKRNRPQLDMETAKAVRALWEDEAVQKMWKARSEFGISDSANFFLDQVEQYADQNYVPNELDILRVRQKTTGISETNFVVKRTRFRMVDVGGQRNERKKWIHCFEDVTSIVYCCSMSDYDMRLAEDTNVNRMHESINLFKQIINNEWFEQKPIILFLNKKDLFEEKIKEVDLSVCFPNYDGGKDFAKGTEFIKKKMLECNEIKGRTIYVHVTCATDTANIKFVFSAVQDILIQLLLNKMF